MAPRYGFRELVLVGASALLSFACSGDDDRARSEAAPAGLGGTEGDRTEISTGSTASTVPSDTGAVPDGIRGGSVGGTPSTGATSNAGASSAGGSANSEHATTLGGAGGSVVGTGGTLTGPGSGGSASGLGGGETNSGGTATGSNAGGAWRGPGGMSATGGASTSSGGATTEAGGSPTNSGGISAGSGGDPAAFGGSSATIGGATSNPGGATSNPGGTTSNPGGTTSNPGGAASASGGTPAALDVDPDALYVAPSGVTSASGTIDAPTTLLDAVARAEGGQTIYLRGGNYTFTTTLSLNRSGSNASRINLRAYPLDSERPLLDFSAMPENSSNRGVTLSGSYWHIYGIDLFKAGDNCMFVSGSNNTLEFMTFSECADTGLQLGGGASHNVILNCDSYFNADSSLENADGFAAKLDVGTGNEFIGCRAWNNLDDGWDGYLRPADDITTTYKNCWAIDNGKLKNGSVGVGDGNGFKTGGSDDKDLRHNAIYEQCIAAGNVNDGFDHNSNRGSVTLLNCAAHNNGSNINFGSSNIAASLTIKNTTSLGNNGSLTATSTDITNNSWQNGLAASTDDFVSVDSALLKSPRKSDGSLPDIDYLKLVPDSDLRNAGVDVGLPYSGSAADIGPFETD